MEIAHARVAETLVVCLKCHWIARIRLDVVYAKQNYKIRKNTPNLRVDRTMLAGACEPGLCGLVCAKNWGHAPT